MHEKLTIASYKRTDSVESQDITVNMPDNSIYILALDVGTTTLRAHIYDQYAKIRGEGSTKIELIHPSPGLVEMDEELLWEQVQTVIKDAIANSGITAQDVKCMGMTVQRNTFINWDKETGEPFHHFITWQDLRASNYVKEYNKSYSMWFLNMGGRFMHLVTRRNRFLAARVLKFKSPQVTMRLKWTIDHNEKLKKRIREKQVHFGNLDTWLLWKLTGGEVYATDYSCASSTGMYDPFQMCWSNIVTNIVGIPHHILPPVRDTSGDFGSCSPELFGAAIPITAVVADQQSAMFGQCCFDEGDVKCTMGTGSFIDCNTGRRPHASIAGLYPLVGWKIGDDITYLAEGHSSDTGSCLEWARNIGLYENVEDTSEIAERVEDSDGVYFVPAFSGLQAPINDDKACTSLIGISPNTTKAHILRAILESLGFRVKLLYETVLKETLTPLTELVRCDGGVCNNNFLVQLVSTLIGRPVDRPHHMDMTSLGATFLAGLAVGVWKDKQELRQIRRTERLFKAQDADKYCDVMDEWRDAMKRCMKWHDSVDI